MNNDTHNITLTEVQVALLRKLLSPSVDPTDDGGYEGDEDAIGIIRQLDISERVCQTGLWLSRYTIDECYGGPEEGGWWYDWCELDWSECLTVEDLVTQWNELVRNLNDEAMPGHELVSVNELMLTTEQVMERARKLPEVDSQGELIPNIQEYSLFDVCVRVDRYTHIELCIELSRGSHISINRPHYC